MALDEKATIPECLSFDERVCTDGGTFGVSMAQRIQAYHDQNDGREPQLWVLELWQRWLSVCWLSYAPAISQYHILWGVSDGWRSNFCAEFGYKISKPWFQYKACQITFVEKQKALQRHIDLVLYRKFKGTIHVWISVDGPYSINLKGFKNIHFHGLKTRGGLRLVTAYTAESFKGHLHDITERPEYDSRKRPPKRTIHGATSHFVQSPAKSHPRHTSSMTPVDSGYDDDDNSSDVPFINSKLSLIILRPSSNHGSRRPNKQLPKGYK